MLTPTRQFQKLGLLSGLLALSLFSQPAVAQRPNADQLKQQIQALQGKIDLQRDVEYAKTGEISLKLDVLQPKERAEKTLPAIVFIHGGGWRSGDKAAGVGRLAPLVATGQYVGFTIQYRLTDVASWPAQIHDCKAAIRWVKAHAEQYGIDPERIAVWGSSAGGHLVSMLGTSGDVKELEGDLGPTETSSRIKCVVNFCGPSDFLSFKLEGASQKAVEPLLGGTVAEQKENAKNASPVTYITADDAPFLTLHGTADHTVPVEQAKILDEKLKAAGVSSTLVLIEGGGHGFGGPAVDERVRNFLAKQLRGAEVEVSSEPIKVAPNKVGN